jgi:hypothetical protein
VLRCEAGGAHPCWVGNGVAGERKRFRRTWSSIGGDVELHTEGLAFCVMFTLPDDEGWMYCNAIVNAPGFRGDLDCYLQRTDLELFRSQLAHAVETSHWPCEARLCGLEPGIDVSFRVERTGQIVGGYRFQSRGVGEATLCGSFGMDQTFLPSLLQQVEEVLRNLGEAVPAAEVPPNPRMR